MLLRRLCFCLVLPLAPCATAAEEADPAVTRGPYLQCGTPDSMHIVWRMRSEAVPVVRFGKSVTALDAKADGPAVTVRLAPDVDGGADALRLFAGPARTRQFEAQLFGLQPDTLYYYAVYDGEKRLTPALPEYSFRTLPVAGTQKDMLLWVVGDSGTGNRVQAAVHTAMQKWTAKEKRPLDLFLHVGDMAYGAGLDSEFQGYFFESYAETLRRTVCWPAMGNHEGRTSSGATGTGPYYDAYICPTAGEAGGLPSGTESYYSFDAGRAHFICLNSHDLPRDPASTMAQWLKADLERTKADWLIAFWHHPPYTKGSHDSDKELQLVEMRKYIMPILEAGGVDVVFTGHSHIYERSMLIDGAYSTPTTSENVVLDAGDGDPSGDGSYQKSAGLQPHEGTVQVVAGHGGTTLSRLQDPSPVMRTTILEFGSVLVDLKKDTLTAMMLNSDGKVRDTFQVTKKGSVTPQRLASVPAPKALSGPAKVAVPGPGEDDTETAKGSKKNKDGESGERVPAQFTAVIAKGAEWQYLAGSPPAAGWMVPGFPGAGWEKGRMGIGYGDNDDVTTITGMQGKFRYLCVRREFEVTGDMDLTKLGLTVSYDDGFIVYLNGKEAARVNVDSGSLDTAKGTEPHEANRKYWFFPLGEVAPSALKPGVNVIAIEGYNDDLGSSDFTLDPSLILTK